MHNRRLPTTIQHFRAQSRGLRTCYDCTSRVASRLHAQNSLPARWRALAGWDSHPLAENNQFHARYALRPPQFQGLSNFSLPGIRRVGRRITPPVPPQSRTYAINVSGSSNETIHCPSDSLDPFLNNAWLGEWKCVKYLLKFLPVDDAFLATAA